MTDNNLWDERVAVRYDGSVADQFEQVVLGPMVDALTDLAGDGPALELGVGTGRVALPLHSKGIEVVGIDASSVMVDRLKAKPGGDDIPVTIGDIATTNVDGSFSLVYVVFNSITNLLTQDAQVECFRNAANHLQPGGHFLIEVFVPALQRLPVGERFVPFDVGDGHVGVDEYDVVTQRSISHHIWVDEGEGDRFSSHHRYAWPAEYDLMAKLAGLKLRHRWGNWRRDTFNAASTAHVSVWEKPEV